MHTTPRQLRNRFAVYHLKRRKCDSCGRYDDATSEACYHCGGTELTTVDLTPRGEVLTYVVQHYLPEEFDTPLPLAIVETPEGATVLGMFTEVEDPHDIDVGDRVTIELKRFARADGQVLYEPKFRPTGGDEP